MATYTITLTSAYENLTGPNTSGNDTYNINGGTLIISTDTRYVPNRTQSNGNVGPVTISTTSGGNIIIDGTQVRLIQYNTGSGNVPAYNTTISQGGTSASLLGVWSALNTIPTASGAAMPTSGYIKVRNKSGNFSAGALTGIGATAVSADVTGWIEVIGVESQTMTVPRLGVCSAAGDWFYVGPSTGLSASTYQLPASQTNTYYPGVWVETASADIYSFYPNAGSINATACPNDARGEVCWIGVTGLLRLGTHNGTNAGGFLPPAGRKIRVPNILLLSCSATSTTTSSNALPNATLGTRYDFTTTNAGVLRFDKVNFGSWYPIFSQPYEVSIKNCGIMDSVNISEQATALDLDNVGVGVTQAQANNPLVLASCFAGGNVQNSSFNRYSLAATGNYVNSVTNINGITFRNNKTTTLTNKANGTTGTWTITNAKNCNWYDNIDIGGRRLHATSVGCHLSGTRYAESFSGAVSTSYTHYMDEFTVKSSNCTCEYYSLYVTSSINAHPYGGIASYNACDNMILRNVGTSGQRLVFGTSNSPANILASVGNCSNIKAQRCYVDNTRTFLFASNNADNIVQLDNCFADYADTAAGVGWLNAQVRGVGCNITSAAQAAIYGTHFYNCFNSTTAGRVGILFNEKTSEYPSVSAYEITSGAPTFTSTGGLYMPTIGMEIVYTTPYFIKGYTAFQNATPQMGGGTIGNYSLEYQIDTGSGFGAYKSMTGANLSSEVITSATGFKLKVKIRTTTNNTAAITGFHVFMTTNATAQHALYPLESLQRTLTLSNLQANSEIRIYAAGTSNELTGIENSSTSFNYNYTWEDTDILVDIVIYNVQYQPVYYYNYSLTRDNTSIPVQQIFDRNYENL